MSDLIKNSAIPAAGYVYQTMQGIALLCDWLDSPSRYLRVRFECDDEAIGPQGLDDIVAERSDGLMELWQVKFTPAPEKYFLDWAWLLDKPGKAGGTSRCLLRKWFDAFNKIPKECLGEIGLLTNRVPDRVVESCLESGFINYTEVSEATRILIETEVGGAENAKRFFEVFRVRHSDKGFTNIALHVTDRLRRHGTLEGVETLKNRAVHWAIQKNQPTTDGWITLDVLRSTLRAVAPEPLPENFVVPPGYRVPDTIFHNDFIAAIEAAPRQPLVLTGPPGRGKSTYLSKVCDVLQKRQIPFVRHHYYLSSTDRTLDRLTSFAVEESLLSQVERFHGVVSFADRGLAPCLSACARYYKALGKPFVVILDGLDHVWRSHGHDKRPLDEVFNQILPSTNNLVLVLGTQPVDDTELPVRLLVEAPRRSWLELPAMSSDAVLSYLRREIKSRRLRLDAHKKQAEEELVRAAAKLRARTNGHPLHVIYATEELVRAGKSLSQWSVEQLSGDLSHDVKTYYSSLWYLLSASQKDILRLICAFEFFWPREAFFELAKVTGTASPEVKAVEHLLHGSAAGLKVFHESLVVFVQQTDDYDERVKQLTPHVATWLSLSAPVSLRVNWLWAVEARLGRPANLIAGLQRDWVLERLQEGYPVKLFENLLGEAEELAICSTKYADAYRLRHLKYRLLNSVSYQLMGVDAARLKICTWALAPDASVIYEAIASRHEESTLDLAALGVALARRGDMTNAATCCDEAYRRYLGESRFGASRGTYDRHHEVLFLVKALAELEVIGRTRQAAARIVDESSPDVARRFLEALVDADRLQSLVGIAAEVQHQDSMDFVVNAVVRTAAIAQADLTEWGEFEQLCHSELASCLASLAGMEMSSLTGPLDTDWLSGSYDERREALALLAHHWLFGAVQLQLSTDDDFCLLGAPNFKGRQNVSEYLNFLAECGRGFARVWSNGKPVTFFELYSTFDSVEFPEYSWGYDVVQGAQDFRTTLHAIAVDIHLLNSTLGSSPLISEGELKLAMACAWFDADEFRKQYVSILPKVLSQEAAVHFINHQLTSLATQTSQETGERMMAYLELCELALRHGLVELGRTLCTTTWDLAIGYSQRKDPALSELMEALDYLTDIEPNEARRLLSDVSPQVHNVLEYTDGKGTRHVLWHADLLLAKVSREALLEKHRQHMELGEWFAAENSLKAFIESDVSGNPAMDAVLRTGVHGEVYDSLRSASSAGNASATHLLAIAEQHVGSDVGFLREYQHTNTSTEWKPFVGDVSTYDVNELTRLQNDLKEHYGVRADVLIQWYRYWVSQGKGSELLAALEPLFLSDACRNHDLHILLDDAFETKRKLKGVRSAFSLIVQAQLMNGGWLGAMVREKTGSTEARLKVVAQRYAARCDEFVQLSTFSWLDLPKSTRIIPSELMVYFLGLQGRTDEAVACAEQMVRCVQDDTRKLLLGRPSWADILAGSSEATA